MAVHVVWNELIKWKCGALLALWGNKRYCDNFKITWKLQTDAATCCLCCRCCLMTCGWSPGVIECLLLSPLSDSRISHSGLTFWPRLPGLEWHPNSERMLQGWRQIQSGFILNVRNMLPGCGNVAKWCRKKSEMKLQSPASTTTKAVTHHDNRKLFSNVIFWGLTSTLPGPWLVFQPPRSWRRAILLPWRHAAAGWSVRLSHESDFSVSARHCSIWHQQHTWAGQVFPQQPGNRLADNRTLNSFYFFIMKKVAAVITWLLY